MVRNSGWPVERNWETQNWLDGRFLTRITLYPTHVHTSHPPLLSSKLQTDPSFPPFQTLYKGPLPWVQTRQAQHPPEHFPHPNRRRRHQGRRTVLPGEENCVCLPCKEGDSRVESPRDLGVRVLLYLVFDLETDVHVHCCRRVTRPHGSSGVVKSKFRVNLPPRAFGASVRVVRVLPLSVVLPILLTHYNIHIDALPVFHMIHTPAVSTRAYRYTSLRSYDMSLCAPTNHILRDIKYQLSFGTR
jgi:hypothetical protein